RTRRSTTAAPGAGGGLLRRQGLPRGPEPASPRRPGGSAGRAPGDGPAPARRHAAAGGVRRLVALRAELLLAPRGAAVGPRASRRPSRRRLARGRRGDGV